MATIVKTYPRLGKPRPWQRKTAFQIDKVALRRSICRESLWDFNHQFWHEVVHDDPVWNWHMRILSEKLQESSELVFRNQPKKYDYLFNVPPGSTKSTIASILLLPWQWTRAPWMRYLNVTFEQPLTMEFGTKSRDVIRSRLYRETFPDIEINPSQDTKLYFTNNHKGERRGAYVKGGITGRHFHYQVLDDLVDPKGVKSEAELKEANECCTQVLPSRVVSKERTPVIAIGQRLAIDDPYGEMLRRAKTGGTPVKHYNFPADIRRGQKVRPRIFKKKYRKGLLNPERFSMKSLESFRNELGDWAYAGQFDQSPIPLSGGMFHIDKIVLAKAPPPPGKFLTVIRWWDKAASKEKWANYTAGVLMGILKETNEVPRYWILDVVRERWDTATRERMIKLYARSDEVFYKGKYMVGMEQEPGSGGKDSALQTVWNLAGFRVVYERSSTDKVARADGFSVQVNAGNVGMVEGNWTPRFLNSLKYFSPGAKEKDEIDASSGGFNKLARKRMRAGCF